MATITAIIIYRSDDDDSDKCLKAIRNITEEIILLDMVRSDKARLKCQKEEINYLIGDEKDIGKNLAKAIESAKSEYLLFLRSNEYPSGQLKNSLLNNRENLSDDAYRVNVLKNYYGRWMKHSGLYPDLQVRLLRKQEGYYIDAEIEKIKLTDETKTVGVVSGDLFSIRYKSIWEHIQAINDSTETGAYILLKEGMKTNILKMIFYPLCHFLNLFFIKLGFLDGFYGMVNTVITGYSVFLEQIKLRELQRLNIRK